VTDTPDGEFSQASYVEIEVYARQIVEQLALLVNSRPPRALTGAGTPQGTGAAIRKEYHQAYAPWSEGDDEYLRSRFLEGATIEDLVSEFGRQPGGIRSRLRQLGLEMPSAASVAVAHDSQAERGAAADRAGQHGPSEDGG
jgi:hypothetical protein